MRPKAYLWYGLLFLMSVVASGCGYTLQRAKNNALEQAGIHRIYIAPILNNTFKAGIENLVFNELQRAIASNDRVRLVSRPEDADAVLRGAVESASYVASAITTAAELLRPPGARSAEHLRNNTVASEYTALLSCSFMLETRKREDAPEKKQRVFWSNSFERSQPFPANNRLGVYGTTSGLMNESEFDRALADMSRRMMMDVEESMLAMF